MVIGTGGVSIFAVPYDSDHRTLRMSAGPTHFAFNGIEEQLATVSHGAPSEVLEASDPLRAEVATAFGCLVFCREGGRDGRIKELPLGAFGQLQRNGGGRRRPRRRVPRGGRGHVV
jgi:hypothetical protein